MNIPANLRYAKTDEWANLEGQTATVGITDYAQDALSDIVYVEIRVSVGDTIRKGQEFGSLESVKAASEVVSPVSGKVVAINESLSDSPEMVNSQPYTGAWMIKVEVSDPAEAASLMDAAAYEAYLQERDH